MTQATPISPAGEQNRQRIEVLERTPRVEVQVWSVTIGAAATTLYPDTLAFQFQPKAIVIGRARIPTSELTLCDAVTGIDWIPTEGTQVRVRRINGATVSTAYELTVVAYG